MELNVDGLTKVAGALNDAFNPILASVGSCVQADETSDVPGAEFNQVVKNWTAEVEAIGAHAAELGSKVSDLSQAVARSDDAAAANL